MGWNQFRKKAGIKTYLLAALIAILPKVGKLSELAIRGPDDSTSERYLETVNRSTSSMREVLGHVDGDLQLPNRDLDTGDPIKPGAYALGDQTYDRLLEAITRSNNRSIPATLTKNILEYYADPSAPITTKKNRKHWERVQTDLALLQKLGTRCERASEIDTEQKRKANPDQVGLFISWEKAYLLFSVVDLVSPFLFFLCFTFVCFFVVVVVVSWANTVEPARRERLSAAAAMVFIGLVSWF